MPLGKELVELRLAVAEELYVDVGAEANVVGEVPTDVVGVFVDDDLVAVPEPTVAEADVIGSDAEIEATEPEAGRTAAGEMPDMAAAKAAGEMAMLPRMIEMIVRIVGAGVMANPLAVVVYVRRFGMARLIGVSGSFGGSAVRSSFRRRRATLRNVSVADVFGRRSRMLPASILRESGNGTEQEQCKNCEN